MVLNFCDNIDKIIYINLDSRDDRNKHMLEQFKKYNISEEKIIRFSAIKHNIGAIGCSMSHCAVIEMAIKNNWNNILVLEDDFVFNMEVQKINIIINLFFKIFGGNYDIFQLTYWFDCRIRKTDYNGFFKVIGCDTTSGYFVNSRFYETLLCNFREGLKLLETNYKEIRNDNYNQYNIDEYWKKIQQISNWYIYLPVIGKQADIFYSDIRNSTQLHNAVNPRIMEDIQKNDIDKYLISEESKHSLNIIFKKNPQNSKIFKITNLGIILNNYEEKNHLFFRIDDKFINTNSILGIIIYYLNHNKWKIKNSKNDIHHTLNKTLTYALKTVGAIYEINMTDIGPIYTLHTNTDFVNENGFFIDGDVKYNDFKILYRWIVYVTDFFNLYYIYYYKKGKNITIYLNRGDCPILPKNKIDMIDSRFPIYSWCTTKEHADILLPMPDIIMWLFKREFYKNIDKKNFIKFENKTNNKCVFRGNMTNELRIKAHTISLENNDKFDFRTSIGTPKLIFSNNQVISDKQDIIDLNTSSNNYLSIQQQQQYKYLLNIDGVASAWRIISEIYYNSVMFIPKSKFIDVIKESLQKDIHYIEINSDLSNLENVYNFVSKNNNFTKIIIENLNKFSQNLDNIDIHMKLMHEKIENNNLNCTYQDLIKIKYSDTKKLYNMNDNHNQIKKIMDEKNIHVNWKCYINNQIFAKKLMKNLKDNKNKYLLCRPEGDFIDILYVISTCYEYCQTVGRCLLVDTKSTTYKINFSEIFDIMHNKKFCEPDVVHDFQIIDKIISNKNFTVYPKIMLDEIQVCSQKTKMNNSTEINFNKDCDEDILYYRHCRNTHDKINNSFLKSIKLNENIKIKIYEKIISIKKPYIAVYIKNMDIENNFINFYENNKHLFYKNKNIYLITNSANILDFFKEKYKNNLFYFTKFSENNELSYHNEEQILIDLLTDIFICSKASDFISGNEISGFSDFIYHIKNKQLENILFNI